MDGDDHEIYGCWTQWERHSLALAHRARSGSVCEVQPLGVQAHVSACLRFGREEGLLPARH